MLCEYCGNQVPNDSVSCKECGAKIKAPAAAPIEAAPPPVSTAEIPSPQPMSAPATPAAPGGYQAPATPGGYQAPATPGGYQAPAAPGGYKSPAENPFSKFSNEMYQNKPVKRTRWPGVLLALVILLAIAGVIGAGVFFINQGLQVKLDDVQGVWSTTIEVTATDRVKGKMTLTLDYLGVGTASFTGHSDITAPLRAEYKNGSLTLTAEGITMTGKVRKSGNTLEMQGTYTIDGHSGNWYALNK